MFPEFLVYTLCLDTLVILEHAFFAFSIQSRLTAEENLLNLIMTTRMFGLSLEREKKMHVSETKTERHLL